MTKVPFMMGIYLPLSILISRIEVTRALLFVFSLEKRIVMVGSSRDFCFYGTIIKMKSKDEKFKPFKKVTHKVIEPCTKSPFTLKRNHSSERIFIFSIFCQSITIYYEEEKNPSENHHHTYFEVPFFMLKKKSWKGSSIFSRRNFPRVELTSVWFN